MTPEHTIAVASTEAGLGHAMDWVRLRLSRAGLDDREDAFLELAVRAALQDAHARTNRRDPGCRIELAFRREPEALEFAITACGPGDGPGPDGGLEAGIRAFFDESVREDAGRTLRLRKRAPPWTREIVADLWRSLGFHGLRDVGSSTWRVTAGRPGLRRLAALLADHARRAEESSTSSAAYGPYKSFRVFGWVEPTIDASGIGGRPEDLRGLAGRIEAKAALARPGERVAVGPEYAPEAPFGLELDVREDGFDPASLDDGP